MRLAGREWALSAAAVASLFALALVAPVPGVLGVAGLAVGGVLARRMPARAVAPLTALALGGLASMGVSGLLAPLEALAWGLVYLLLLFTSSRERARQRLGLLVSALVIAVAAIGTRDLMFLVAFAAWAVCLPAALAATSRGAASVGWVLRVTPAVLLVATSLFWLLPRPGGSELALRSAAVTGVGDAVTLGELGEMLVDTTPVLRMRLEPLGGQILPQTLYVRAAVLDHFDGREWKATPPLSPMTQASLARGIRAEMLQSERPGGALFSFGQPAAVMGVEAQRDASGNLRSNGTGAVAWTLVAAPPFGPGEASPADLDDVDLARALQLPVLDQRLHAAAGALDGDDPASLALAAKTWLLDTATYSRDPRDAAVEDPLAAFLFERRNGHCEYFASAAAVLLRARGVPTRLVHGFVSDERNDAGGYRVFRASHAHAWVEFHDGRGWVLLDPTPGPGLPPEPAESEVVDALRVWWAEQVVGFDGGEQRAAVQAIGQSVGGVMGASGTQATELGWVLLTLGAGFVLVVLRVAVGVLLASLAGERRRRRPGVVEQAWLLARDSAIRRSGTPPSALPPLSAAEWLAEVDPAGEDLKALAWLHYRVLYGGEADATLAPEAVELSRRARAARAG